MIPIYGIIFVVCSRLNEVSKMSSVEIGMRTEKTEDNPYGYVKVDSISKDEVCVLCLGGDGTTEDKAANGFAKVVKNQVLTEINADIPVYSVTYNFNDCDVSLARQISNIRHRTEVLTNGVDIGKKLSKATEEENNPQYVNNLFEKVILPRITLLNGNGKLSVEEACKRIRKLNIVAHCHGAYTALKLEEKMQSAMKQLGYNDAERKNIQSQMLVVALAPACPLGVSKSEFISFKSAYDGNIPLKNNFFDKYIELRKAEEIDRFDAEVSNNKDGVENNRWFDLTPCFFQKKQGNLFLFKQKYEWNTGLGPALINKAEHNNINFNDRNYTKHGKLLGYFSKTILKNGIKNSLQQDDGFAPLPPIEELVLSGNSEIKEKEQNAFEKMKQNGKNFREKIFQMAVNYHKKWQKQHR